MEPTEEATYRQGVKDTLNLILVQTTKTNGSVAETKRDLAALQLNYKSWRGYITGGLAVLSLFFVAAVAIIAAYITVN